MRTTVVQPILLTGILASLGSLACADYVDTILADSPLAYYRFEDAAGGSNIVDSSGHGHDSINVLNAELGVAGVHGNAVEFTGDGSIIVDLLMDPGDPEGDGVGVGNDDFSIELFVKLQPSEPPRVFISQQNGDGFGRSNMLLTESGFLGSFLGGSTSNSEVEPYTDTWYHFVMTYDGGAMAEPIHFYVDGQPAGTGTAVLEPANGNWVIGSNKIQRQNTDGLMDEVSFYDYRIDDPNADDDTADSRVLAHFEGTGGVVLAPLQPGDANMDYQFDQLDLVMVQIAAKYLTGQVATWGEGDWNGPPGGTPGNPSPGDGLFNQLDIIAALGAGTYLQGPYAADPVGRVAGDNETYVDLVSVPVPEPSSIVVLILGLAGLLAAARRR